MHLYSISYTFLSYVQNTTNAAISLKDTAKCGLVSYTGLTYKLNNVMKHNWPEIDRRVAWQSRIFDLPIKNIFVQLSLNSSTLLGQSCQGMPPPPWPRLNGSSTRRILKKFEVTFADTKLMRKCDFMPFCILYIAKHRTFIKCGRCIVSRAENQERIDKGWDRKSIGDG